MSILKKHFKNSSNISKLIDIKEENLKISQQMDSMGSWTRDLINKEIYFSENIYNILETNPDNFDGNLDRYYLLVHPDDVEEYKRVKQKELTGFEYEIDYRVKTPMGVTKYLHEKTKAIYDENKKPLKMVGIIHDITNHKIVENNLREIGENLNKAQSVSGVGSWKYDVIKDENFWSDEVYNIFNLDPNKFGRSLNNLLNLVHHDDRQKFHEDIKKGLEGKAYKHEYRIPQPDGTNKYVISKGEPVLDINNNVTGIIGTIQDITENKTLENRLNKIHKNLTDAQKLSHIGSWEIDIKQGRCYWSEENCRIFGIPEDNNNVNHEEFKKHVHPEDKEFFKNIFVNPQKSNIVDTELRIIRSDGSLRNIYTKMEFKYDENENLTNIYGTTQDITEQKRSKKR